jgi:hypothetical protein
VLRTENLNRISHSCFLLPFLIHAATFCYVQHFWKWRWPSPFMLTFRIPDAAFVLRAAILIEVLRIHFPAPLPHS